MISRKCGIKKFWQSGRLVDSLCQHSTEEHMHPCSGHFNHPYVTDYQSFKFQVYYMTKSHGSYLRSIYIYCSEIYFCSIYILVILKRLFSCSQIRKNEWKVWRKQARCSLLGAVFRVLNADLIIENALNNMEKWPKNQENMY